MLLTTSLLVPTGDLASSSTVAVLRNLVLLHFVVGGVHESHTFLWEYF